MYIEKNKNIKHLNTFGINVSCANYLEIENSEELITFFTENKDDWFILGGGSNVLFTEDYNGTIIHLTNSKIDILNTENTDVYIKADAGVVWDDLVSFSIEHNLYGLENLSYIPGSVGASPVQNIGAYGVEAKDVIYSVEYLDTETLTIKTIAGCDCEFGYRHSIFKTKLKNKVIVLSVTYKLSKEFTPILSYGGLKQHFSQEKPLLAKELRDTIISIRKEKLPEPKEIGNGGSFFKNPVVTNAKFEQLKSEYPEIPSYVVENGVKIPAAWLIEQSGWKGRRIGDAGVHKNQALVLVNYGDATGNDVLEVSKSIQSEVSAKFDIDIYPEINIL